MKFRRSTDSRFNCVRFSIEGFNDMILLEEFGAHFVKKLEKLCVGGSGFVLRRSVVFERWCFFGAEIHESFWGWGLFGFVIDTGPVARGFLLARCYCHE
jgi:hypothetical protein